MVNRLIAILFVFLIGVILFFYGRTRLLQSRLDVAEGYKSLYISNSRTSHIWKDQAGYWRAKSESSEVGTSTLKDAVKNNDPQITQILKEFPAIKKNFSNLLSYSLIQAQTISELKGILKDSLSNKVIGKDTIKVYAKKGHVEDEWSTYDITIVSDSFDIKRIGREEIEGSIYYERLTKKGNKTLWPFGKKVWSSEVVSKNPETKIVNTNNIIVKKKK